MLLHTAVGKLGDSRAEFLEDGKRKGREGCLERRMPPFPPRPPPMPAWLLTRQKAVTKGRSAAATPCSSAALQSCDEIRAVLQFSPKEAGCWGGEGSSHTCRQQFIIRTMKSNCWWSSMALFCCTWRFSSWVRQWRAARLFMARSTAGRSCNAKRAALSRAPTSAPPPCPTLGKLKASGEGGSALRRGAQLAANSPPLPPPPPGNLYSGVSVLLYTAGQRKGIQQLLWLVFKTSLL